MTVEELRKEFEKELIEKFEDRLDIDAIFEHGRKSYNYWTQYSEWLEQKIIGERNTPAWAIWQREGYNKGMNAESERVLRVIDEEIKKYEKDKIQSGSKALLQMGLISEMLELKRKVKEEKDGS